MPLKRPLLREKMLPQILTHSEENRRGDFLLGALSQVSCRHRGTDLLPDLDLHFCNASSTWAGPVGCLWPCPQLSSVPLATPMLRANAPCDRRVLARIAATSTAGTAIWRTTALVCSPCAKASASFRPSIRLSYTLLMPWLHSLLAPSCSTRLPPPVRPWSA